MYSVNSFLYQISPAAGTPGELTTQEWRDIKRRVGRAVNMTGHPSRVLGLAVCFSVLCKFGICIFKSFVFFPFCRDFVSQTQVVFIGKCDLRLRRQGYWVFHVIESLGVCDSVTTYLFGLRVRYPYQKHGLG